MKLKLARITVVALTVALALSAVPAFAAVVTGPVPHDCTVSGYSLKGLEPAAARALIASVTPAATRMPLTFTAAGKTLRLAPAGMFKTDVERMLAVAYEPTTTVGFEIAPAYFVSTSLVRRWVDTVAAKAVDRKASSSRYILKNSRVTSTPYVIGRKLDRTRAYSGVRSIVVSSLAASAETTFSPVALRVIATRPSVTKANLGKVLLVDVSERRLWLYKNGRLERTFRVAVGTSDHPTPRGTFKIIGKVKNPSWTNPAPSGWGAGMPAYIGPGPSNPLGTRALYLNSPGIRIHGTSKRYSIGTAASHGCMRMLREEVEALYPLVPVGTTVYIVK
ncbi:MAG: L,D-transpeptidase [Coriobacteriia bacterium]|nr:L,D-transpeptidase [Coriobacteriia bacterium]